nr:thioredoxin [Lachnotalea sp. AF33-28]
MTETVTDREHKIRLQEVREMAAMKITNENFQKEVLEADVPVLVDFWASWCGPCKMLLPIVEELAGEVKNARIGKVNVDEQPELAERFRVMTIPTLILFKNGQVVDSSVGVKPKSAILNMIEKAN